MKKALTKKELRTYYIKDGVRTGGVPEGITGDLTYIRGNLTDITGDLSGITGNLTGIRGDLSGIYGNLDNCEITQEDRDRGIDVSELIV